MSDYIPNLTSAVRQNADIVIAAGFLLANSVATMAKKCPDTQQEGDRCGDGPKRVDVGVYAAIQQIKQGKWNGGHDLVFDLTRTKPRSSPAR